MVDIKSRWKGVTDRTKWAARGASFVAKAKATKLVWFPPKPDQAGEKAVSTGKQATTNASERTTAVAKETLDGPQP